MSGEAAPAIWLQNPFDWDGGWHVLVKGGPKPEPGAAVTVTRRDGSESVETVVAVVCSHHRYAPPAVWWLCAVEATRPRPPGGYGPPEPVTIAEIEIGPPEDLKARKGCLSALLLWPGA